MKEFFVENWKFIMTLILSFLMILITLFRKTKLVNKVVDTPFERVLALLPGLIVEAEKSYASGADKASLVLSKALSIYQKLIDRELTNDEVIVYSRKISSAIEKILETPQKKGVSFDDTKKED